MITAEQAKAEGYTIDNHAPGRPVGYKGPRFAPTEWVSIFTDVEEQMLAVLAPLASTVSYMQSRVGVHEGYKLHIGADAAKQIVEAVAAARGAQ